jgi:uncharacterized protein GlcG (DUF336 family)
MLMVLKLAEAKKIIDGAIAKARELKVEVSVAVCNHEGRVIALNRMDGVSVADASWKAIGKAVASAAWGVASDKATGRANRAPTRSAIGEGAPAIRSAAGCRSFATPSSRERAVCREPTTCRRMKSAPVQGSLRCSRVIFASITLTDEMIE